MLDDIVSVASINFTDDHPKLSLLHVAIDKYEDHQIVANCCCGSQYASMYVKTTTEALVTHYQPILFWLNMYFH